MNKWWAATFICAGLVCTMMWRVGAADTSPDAPQPPGGPESPPVETLFVEPLDVEHLGIWVPASRSGPVINASCGTRTEQTHYSLTADVQHTKTASCPPEAARLLAEYVAGYCQPSLPLTMLDGWRWECPLGLCQYESVTFQLSPMGGSWENATETMLHLSSGTLDGQWLERLAEEDAELLPDRARVRSSIEVLTFGPMRTRNGYPKTRIFR